MRVLFRAPATDPGRAWCLWKLSLATVFVTGLLSCSTHQPKLSRLYRTTENDIDDDSHVRLWPAEVKRPLASVDYQSRMLEPGDGAVTKASLLARTELDPSIARHMYSDFPLDYAVMFCGDHSELPGNITFQDNLLHILLSR